MPKLPVTLLLCLALSAGEKTHRTSVHGPLTAKGTLGPYPTLTIHDELREADFTCVIEAREPHFRDYRIGDVMVAGGTERGNSRTLMRCIVAAWTQK